MLWKNVHCIMNPNSGQGRTEKNWHQFQNVLEKKFSSINYKFTEKEGGAFSKAKESLEEKADLIIIVGGDGTISEIVNAFKKAKLSKTKLPKLALLNSGTGGDFCRYLKIPKNIDLAVERILNGRIISVDIGKLNCLSLEGKSIENYFVNVASFGLSGLVVKNVNKREARKSPQFYYLRATLKSFFSYQKIPVKISYNNQGYQTSLLITQVIYNGSSFGGGMCIAPPKARIDDGCFSMVCIKDLNSLQALWQSRRLLYRKTLKKSKNVIVVEGTSLSAEAVEENDNKKVLIDADGECIGTLPIKVELLSQALDFVI